MPKFHHLAEAPGEPSFGIAASAPSSARLSAHVKPCFLAATSVQNENLRGYGYDDGGDDFSCLRRCRGCQGLLQRGELRGADCALVRGGARSVLGSAPRVSIQLTPWLLLGAWVGAQGFR